MNFVIKFPLRYENLNYEQDSKSQDGKRYNGQIVFKPPKQNVQENYIDLCFIISDLRGKKGAYEYFKQIYELINEIPDNLNPYEKICFDTSSILNKNFEINHRSKILYRIYFKKSIQLDKLKPRSPNFIEPGNYQGLLKKIQEKIENSVENYPILQDIVMEFDNMTNGKSSKNLYIEYFCNKNLITDKILTKLFSQQNVSNPADGKKDQEKGKIVEETKKHNPVTLSNKKYYANGMLEYIGDLDGNKKNGYGKYFDISNDQIYEGYWKNDFKHGKGKLIFNDNSYYEGLFENNLQHGKGILCFSDGSIEYDGQWIKGKKEGRGTEFLPGGGKYEGQFVQGRKSGKGEIKNSEDKKVLEGTWENGLRHGKFMFYNKDGSLKETKYFVNDIESAAGPKTVRKIEILGNDNTNGDSGIVQEYVIPANHDKKGKVYSQKIVEKFGILITDDDLKTLSPKAWLNGNVINFYMYAVYERYKEKLMEESLINPKRLYFFDSDFFSNLTNGSKTDISLDKLNYTGIKKYISRNAIEGFSIFDLYDRLIFIINANNSHWCLAEIEVQKNSHESFIMQSKQCKFKKFKFLLRDSMKSDLKDQEEPILKILQEFVKSQFSKVKDDEILKLIEAAEFKKLKVPQQTTFYDCGAYTCLFVKRIVTNIEYLPDPNDMRQEIQKVIKGEINPLNSKMVKQADNKDYEI